MIPPNTLVINVTANDIEHGVAVDSVLCPVARAAARVLRRYGCAPVVGPTTLCVTDQSDFCIAAYALPDEAQALVLNFDLQNGLAFPQVFTLDRMP